MQYNFQFSSLSDLFSSFKTPVAERRLNLAHTKIRVQKRGPADRPEYHLRISKWGNISYVRLEEAELEQLAQALIEIKLS